MYAIYAYKMGLPINKIVCATNENNVLNKFFETGIYDVSQKFVQTNSPSMDIIKASNLERFLYLIYKDTAKISELYNELDKNKKFSIDLTDIKKEVNILSGYSKDDETVENIRLSYKKNKNLIDPHLLLVHHLHISSQVLYAKL